MTVLIVDDETFIGEELSDVFKFFEIECLVTTSVDQAIKVLKSDTLIKLVITDLRMPEKSGEDLIKEAGADLGLKTNFVIMSGHLADQRTKDYFLNTYEHVTGFISKPIGIEDIKELIKKYFSKVSKDSHLKVVKSV